jgi:cell wall-associated NlpC family hydrolase
MAAPRRPVNPALRVVPALLVVLVACGCAPKRVVRQDVRQTAEARRPTSSAPAPSAARGGDPDTQPVFGLDLPPPEPRGPAGPGVPERSSASLTFGAQAAALAGEQLGKPYQWGASGPDRFDCSGLVQHVYGSLGVDLPRVSAQQARVGREVRSSELQAGDLLFFAINGRGIDHVGIFTGGSQFIHAPNRSTPVSTESLTNPWWRKRFRLARRLR